MNSITKFGSKIPRERVNAHAGSMFTGNHIL